jgi:hypothetical protein
VAKSWAWSTGVFPPSKRALRSQLRLGVDISTVMVEVPTLAFGRFRSTKSRFTPPRANLIASGCSSDVSCNRSATLVVAAGWQATLNRAFIGRIPPSRWRRCKPWLEANDGYRETIAAAFPRAEHFKEEIIRGFYDGIKHKPETAFGNVKADAPADKDAEFKRTNFCSVIRGSQWKG